MGTQDETLWGEDVSAGLLQLFVNVREEPGGTEAPRRMPSPQSRVGFLVRLLSIWSKSHLKSIAGLSAS